MRATWVAAAVGLVTAGVALPRFIAAQRAARARVALARPYAPLLRFARDSFAIRFSGMPEGSEVHEFSRAGTGYRYVSEFHIGPAFSQHFEVNLDTQLRVLRARSESRIGQQRGMSDVTYTGHRARGEAVPTQGSSPKKVLIDTILPAGAFDGLALYPIILGRHWQVGDVDTLTIFDTDENFLSRQTIRVTRSEVVQAAGVSSQALRVELSTTQLPVTLWLSVAVPHRLLKVASANGETTLVQ
jgi:hypothetical protein